MGRWEPNGRRRMQEAALALFEERGYARTTAAEVAGRAGLTERTFFRHFPDKREVLFADEDDPRHLLIAAVAGAPEGVAPMEAVAAGLEAVAGGLQVRREDVVRRARVVAAHAELRERELTKLASWSEALERTLYGRGLPGPDAGLLAEVSVAVFRVAYRRWLDEDSEPGRELVTTVRETFAGLGDFFGRAALGPRSHPPPGVTVLGDRPG